MAVMADLLTPWLLAGLGSRYAVTATPIPFLRFQRLWHLRARAVFKGGPYRTPLVSNSRKFSATPKNQPGKGSPGQATTSYCRPPLGNRHFAPRGLLPPFSFRLRTDLLSPFGNTFLFRPPFLISDRPLLLSPLSPSPPGGPTGHCL